MSSENYIIRDQNVVYFLTFPIVDWVDIFTRPAYKMIIVDSLNYCIESKGLTVYTWCLMTNHLHLIARAKDGYRLCDIIRDFKKFTAKKIIDKIKEEPESRREWLLYRFSFAGKFDNRIKNYKVWQDTSHPVVLENNDIIDQKINYIHDNPVRALIVQNPQDYLFSSASDYAGIKGMVNIETEI